MAVISIFALQSNQELVAAAQENKLRLAIKLDASQKKLSWSAALTIPDQYGMDGEHHDIVDKYGHVKRYLDVGQCIDAVMRALGVDELKMYTWCEYRRQQNLPTDITKAAAARAKRLAEIKAFADAEAVKADAQAAALQAQSALDQRYADAAAAAAAAASSMRADSVEAQRQIDALPAISMHPD